MTAPFTVVAGVLIAAGIAKLRSPAPVVELLRALRLPTGPRTGRAIGGGEVVLGAAAVVTGTAALAVAVAAVYAAFAAVLGVVVARRLPVATCGCLGGGDNPPSWVHVAFDAAAAAVAVASAITGGGGLSGVTGLSLPVAGVLVLLAGVGAVLARLVLVDLAGVEAAMHPGRRQS